MRIIFLAVPALVAAGAAVAQEASRPSPLDPKAKVPPVEFRSALEGYRSYAEQDLRDWRKANEELAKPAPGKPQRPGEAGEKGRGAPTHQGHGAHK